MVCLISISLIIQINPMFTEVNRNNEMKNKEICGQSDSDSAISSAKPLVTDLPYKECEWTPVDLRCRKRYEREFLFAVNEKSESTRKMPEYLLIGKRTEIIRKVSKPSIKCSFNCKDDSYSSLLFFRQNFSTLLLFIFTENISFGFDSSFQFRLCFGFAFI